MKAIVFKLAVAAATIGGVATFTAPALAAGLYLPFGPQQNVAKSIATDGGWKECYSATYGTPLGNTADSAVASCSGDLLMLAARQTGSSVFSLLAAAPRSEVLAETTGNNTTNSNGSEWYYRPSWSWGFAPSGAAVSLNQADTLSGAQRLSWHTFNFVGGYRVGNVIGLNSNSRWEKVILSADSSATKIPTPALLPGLIGMGIAAYRKRKGSGVEQPSEA